MVHSASAVPTALSFAIDIAERALAASIPDRIPSGGRPLRELVKRAKRLQRKKHDTFRCAVLVDSIVGRVQQGAMQMINLCDTPFEASLRITCE